jgi:GNAT superfamily N-acetyltransferase
MREPPTNPIEQRLANLIGLKHELEAMAAKANRKPSLTIRPCRQVDFETMYAIINDAAEAYRGVIPEDCWRVPYMSREELRHEIAEGVAFWGCEEDAVLAGVMGIQDVLDVTLIRHAYIRTSRRNQGLGGKLLAELLTHTTRPVLVGTWAAAEWAIRFYQRHGFRLVTPEEKDRLLRTYWSISDRQVETSVVLADEQWRTKLGEAG